MKMDVQLFNLKDGKVEYKRDLPEEEAVKLLKGNCPIYVKVYFNDGNSKTYNGLGDIYKFKQDYLLKGDNKNGK